MWIGQRSADFLDRDADVLVLPCDVTNGELLHQNGAGCTLAKRVRRMFALRSIDVLIDLKLIPTGDFKMVLQGMILDVDGTFVLSNDAHAQAYVDAFAE